MLHRYMSKASREGTRTGRDVGWSKGGFQIPTSGCMESSKTCMNERRMCNWLLHSGFRRKQGLVSVWWVVLWPRKAEITCLKNSNNYCYPNS